MRPSFVAFAVLLGAMPACARGTVPVREPDLVVESDGAPVRERERVAPEEDLAAWLAGDELLAQVVESARDYRFEVLLGIPDPTEPRWLSRQRFRVDEEYFYPASAIKLPIAVAALEATSEAGIDPHSVIARRGRPVPRGGASTVADVVDRAIVVSDNAASNLLFDLVGSDDLHERMWRLGLQTVRVRHRLGGVRYDSGRETPSLTLLPPDQKPLRIAARTGRLDLGRNEGEFLGDAFVAGGKLRRRPMSFEQRNRIGLADLQDLLVAVVRPDLHAPRPLPRLGEEERALLLSSLQARPSSRGLPVAADALHEPLLAGLERVVPSENILVASKSGQAYGFLVDNAFVVDLRTQRSLFLTAVVYANANRRMNDDAYEYETVAFPLLARLGEVIATHVFGPGPSEG